MTTPNDNSQAAQPLGLPLNDGLGPCTYKCEAWPECGCATERAALDLKGAEIERLTESQRKLIAALERISEWVCYASEEDTSSKPLALQQIGLAAREAMATVGESAKPTPAPGQCQTCGEYSMSARAMQGLYGTRVDLG